jgi:hypothetical protein
VAATAFWLLLLACMPADAESTERAFSDYFYATVGLVIGLIFRDRVEKRPWLLMCFPLLLWVFGLLGM